MKTPFDRDLVAPSDLSTKRHEVCGKRDEIPLGYLLIREYGYKAFLQHCVDEINVDNLQFLSEICYFKKKFLERIEKLHMIKLQNLNKRQSKKYRDDDESALGNFAGGGSFHHRFSIPDERLSAREQHRRVIQQDKLLWTPCNSLTILTLKMKHGLEELPELRDSDDDNNNNNNKNRYQRGNKGEKRRKKKNNLYAQWRKKQQQNARRKKLQQLQQNRSYVNSNKIDIEDRLFKKINYDGPYILENHNSVSHEVGINLSADNRGNYNDSQNNVAEVDDDIPLYVMGYGLYLKFIKEGGDSEVNITSKQRTQLHWFFHPSNLLRDDNNGRMVTDITPGGVVLGPNGPDKNQYYKPTRDDPPVGPPNPNAPSPSYPISSAPIAPRGGRVNIRKFNTPGGPGRYDEDEDKDDLIIYEWLKMRENPDEKYSYAHLFWLYHIFDGAWAEIFYLVERNVYPRFTSNGYYQEIKDNLRKDFDDETIFLKHLVSRELNEWFQTIKPRSLVITNADKMPSRDEKLSYFGKPLERVNRAVI